MHNCIALSPRRERAAGRLLILLVGVLSGLAAAIQAPEPARAAEVTCTGGAVGSQPRSAGQPDLLVTGTCTIQKVADYYYGDVRIIQGGKLVFTEPAGTDTKVDFWARNILVENGGALLAGDSRPYGAQGNGTLTILLYGPNQSAGDPAANPGQGVLCHSDGPTPCGIPNEVWSDNGANLIPGCGDQPPGPNSKCLPGMPAGESDFFYQYGPLYGDGKPGADGRIGYFGYKTLGVSYGGTLVLNGHKGASYSADVDRDHVNAGGSWLRLAKSLRPEEKTLQLDRSPGTACGGQPTETCGWRKGDKIVVTTTDYLPGHSEELTVDTPDKQTVSFDPPVKWHHNGTRFGIKERLEKAGVRARLEAGGMNASLIDNGAETRAGVALLTRSIRIVSAGDDAGETFEQAGNKEANCKNGVQKPYCYSFGAHTVIRQGFAKVQIQGVEFENLGQPGKLGHYPVHFHMARKTPADTYVKDSSVNESMTRWYVLHSTLGVTFARNVGYKSIGHGYYLEEGTEADNAFYANIGILARASLENEQNPRRIPGILSDNSPREKQGDVDGHGQDYFPYFSDYNHPSVFWITNGWNDFIGNMAAGATACGACYWFVPSLNTDMPDVPTDKNVDQTDTGGHMKWTGYPGLQNKTAFVASTPLKSFVRNHCSSAMNSFTTVGDTAACHGVVPAVDTQTENVVKAVPSFAPYADKNPHYYPNAPGGGSRQGTFCPPGADGKPDCSNVADKCSAGHPENCAVTVLDHYVLAFHWAEQNLSAIWLCNQWYLVDNSVLSDVQLGGLTFITGGDYTYSSVIPGYWSLAKSSLFIGHSQTQKSDDPAFNAYTIDTGPFNNFSGLQCEWQNTSKKEKSPSNYCLSKAEGVSIPLTAFSVNQRLFNIYDGPAYQAGNAYFDITTTDCPITGARTDKPGCMYGTAVALGVRKVPETAKPCEEPGGAFLPNAAVAWKQPNGFFYPPAFHSENLFFDNVDIRHYVVNPLFKAPDNVTGDLDFHQGGTYLTDFALAQMQFCTSSPDMFNGFSGIDRQTELSDDDGSLTGLINDLDPQKDYAGTISVNQDPFFAAPVESAECRSNFGISPIRLATRSRSPNARKPPARAPTIMWHSRWNRNVRRSSRLGKSTVDAATPRSTGSAAIGRASAAPNSATAFRCSGNY
jgi:cell migration-inducing and hyaluronan-binding protein